MRRVEEEMRVRGSRALLSVVHRLSSAGGRTKRSEEILQTFLFIGSVCHSALKLGEKLGRVRVRVIAGEYWWERKNGKDGSDK